MSYNVRDFYRRREKLRDRNKHLKREYGITSQIYGKMYEKQLGRCAICLKQEDKLYVDHNHKTEKVRGLLCRTCNLGIGHLKDDIKLIYAAADYLEQTE